jgi:hypothetical protein
MQLLQTTQLVVGTKNINNYLHAYTARIAALS